MRCSAGRCTVVCRSALQCATSQCGAVQCSPVRCAAADRRWSWSGSVLAPHGRLLLKTVCVEEPPVFAAQRARFTSGATGEGFGLLGENRGGWSVVEVVGTVPAENAGKELDRVAGGVGDPVSGDSAVVDDELVNVGSLPIVSGWCREDTCPACGRVSSCPCRCLWVREPTRGQFDPLWVRWGVVPTASGPPVVADARSAAVFSTGGACVAV